jgi:uncharacterized protein YbjT (DUF2867 family)
VGKSACILGASGLVGNHLLSLLAKSSSFDKITLLSRREISCDSNTVNKIINFNNIAQELKSVKCDHLFICFGTTIKKVKTKEAFIDVDYRIPFEVTKSLKENGCERVSLLSSIGASPSSSSQYLQTKGHLEDDLIHLDLDSLNIFRPSVLDGKRNEFRFLEEVSIVLGNMLLRWIPVFKKYRPIRIEDVAKCIVSLSTYNNKFKIIESDEMKRIADEFKL